MTKRILLFSLIILLALKLGFFTFSPSEAISLVKNLGYPVMLVLHALFAGFLLTGLRGELTGWRERMRKKRGVVVFLLLAAGSLHVHERHEYKIVADELLVCNVAMQMHFQRESSMVARAYDYAGNYTVLNTVVDKRPLAFPFLLATVHDLTGYRVNNVFWLNGAISLMLVVLMWLVATRLGGEKAGLAAVLLLCGVPLVAQNATSGGFELYNMAMILMTLWLGMRYAERPDHARLGAFILSGIILAQSRYESAIFILPVGLSVLWVWARERRMDLSPVVLAAPLLVLLIPLQQNVFKVSEATWQLNDIEGATSPFGLRYFYDNVGHALNFFINFDGTQPSSWLVGILGCVAVGFVVLTIYREYRQIFREKPVEVITVIFFIGLLLHTAMMLCYFWGRWDDPIIRRLSLPVHVLLIVAVIFVWVRLVRHARAWDGLIAAAALYLMAFAIPASARHMFTQENFAAATCNWVSDYIRDEVPGTALAIDENAGHVWFLHRKACINPSRFSLGWEGYATHFERRSFSDYLVVQRVGVDQATDKKYVSLKDDFGPGLKLQMVAEKAFAPFYIMRISRVVGVDRDELKKWAESRAKEREEMAKAGKHEVWIPEGVNLDLLSKWFKALP